MLFKKSLHEAVEEGNVKRLLKLFDTGADVDERDEEKQVTPLYLAARAGNREIVDLLLSYGATVDKRGPLGDTPLFQSVQEGHFGIAKLLIARGADIHARTKKGVDPLMIATKRGRLKIVLLLLEHGADVNELGHKEHSPLSVAIEEGQLELVRLFIDRGADVNRREHKGMRPLMHAVRAGDPEIVQILLDHGADVDAADDEGATPLVMAAFKGHFECARALLDAGADATVPVTGGIVPSKLARQQENHRVATLLEEYELKPDSSRNLIEAISTLKLAAVKQILKERPDRIHSRTSGNGWTALHLAVKQGHVPLARLLLKNGAEVNAANLHDETPLYGAVSAGHAALVQLLLAHGADPARASQGVTPVDMAVRRGHQEIEAILRNRGVAAAPVSAPLYAARSSAS